MIVIILGIILILGLIFVSSNLHLPRVCTRELKLCSDGSYVGRDSYNNCEFQPCSSGTTTTITSVENVDLDDLVKNPALYVNKYVNVTGYVVKNVGAFFGETYFLQSFSGIQNFKSLSESSTGTALAGNYNFESIVSYTFDGRNYNSSNPEVVTIVGVIMDRGYPPPTDVSRYYFDVQKVTSTTTTTGQCGGWPGGLPEPYMPRIGGQKENYTVGETVTLDLYLKNNPRCEGGQWANRNLTLNTLSFSVDVERIISPPIPSTKEPIISEIIQSASVGPVVVPSGTEIKVGQWTWNQKDSQGKQVGEGTYEIMFTTLDPNIHTSIATLIIVVS